MQVAHPDFTPPQNNPVVTPKVLVLSTYSTGLVVAALLIVLFGWPHAWVLVALVPLAIGAWVLIRAMRAARAARDSWLDRPDS